MPLKISDLTNLKMYVDGVMSRADHHAGGVQGIALTLLGAIIWKGDEASIEVFGSAGPAGNVLWVKVSGKRYAFTYDHEGRKILVKENSTQGQVLNTFDDSTPLAEVVQFFP